MVIIVRAAARLKARQTTKQDVVMDLIQKVERVMDRHHIEEQRQPFPNPKMYKRPSTPDRKPVTDEFLQVVQKDLEKLGFKFKHLPIHTRDTTAVESEGNYSSVHYILDLVLRHHELEVDLYY